MNVHHGAIHEAVAEVSGLYSFRLLLLKMRVGSCGAVCDKARHWWRKQWGPHTLRPISMVQHIKLSFTDKRHSALLLVTLVLQQVVEEWKMASLCLNDHSTCLFSMPYSGIKHKALNAGIHNMSQVFPKHLRLAAGGQCMLLSSVILFFFPFFTLHIQEM